MLDWIYLFEGYKNRRLVREQAGKGFPQVSNGFSFCFILITGTFLWGIGDIEIVGQWLGFAEKQKKNVEVDANWMIFICYVRCIKQSPVLS